MTRALSWFDELKAWPVADVAARFGLEVVRRGADVSFPYPVCSKDVRHSRGADVRKAVKVMTENRWWCEPCGAGGDGVSLAAAIAVKSASPDRHEWRVVRAACVSMGKVIGEPLERHVVAYAPPLSERAPRPVEPIVTPTPSAPSPATPTSLGG